MARAVRKLHLQGLAHSDLSCNNILVDPKNSTCAVIDIDSLVVPNFFPPDVLGTPGYIAPEVIATQHLQLKDANRRLPSNTTDLHALGVLIYEYLLRRHPLRGPKVNCTSSTEEDDQLSMGAKALFIENPHDTSNRPTKGRGGELLITYELLGKYLSKIVYQAFVEGLHDPAARPSADRWEDALCRTSDLIVPCGNSACEEKWFIYLEGQQLQCPFCGWQLKSKIPVLDFHFAPRKGQFRPENHCLVAWEQRPLNLWHVFTNVRPVEGVSRDTQAYVCFYQGQWILVNKCLDSLLSPSGVPVPRGKACPLREGDEILLSNDPRGRLLSVRMIP